MAKEANFDYAKLLETRRADVEKFVKGAQKASPPPTRPTSRWRASSPASRRSPTTT
jgi:hypothetical protein